jgi:hypothetical protein
MAKEDTPPPAQAFSEMVTQWERNFDAFANQVMGTEAYSQTMNDMQKAQLTFQRGFADAMAQQLAAMNLPSREDIIQLSEQVRQVDMRMERIEAALVANDAPKKVVKKKPAKKKPARTKQPPNME